MNKIMHVQGLCSQQHTRCAFLHIWPVFYDGGVGGGGAVLTGELWACFLEEAGFTP